MTAPERDEARAGRRLLMMNLTRLAGALMVPVGFALTAGRLDWVPSDWSRPAGILVTLGGLLLFLLGPSLLARRWASPGSPGPRWRRGPGGGRGPR